ncbi:MAG TPA: methyltransferase domain-containing protein [Bryobacteraceae bacterium]|jgi:SAM-dependent methyltransferase
MTAIQPREAYALLASEYDRAPNALASLEERTMAPLLPELRGRTVVDVAAGPGRWATRCASRGASAISVDFCYEMLRFGAPPRVQADARRLPFRDSCADLVVCAFALGYAPEIFTELRRVVRPGGMVLASDVHPDALRRGWTRTFRYSGARLDREAEASRGLKPALPDVIEIAHQLYALEDLRAPDLWQTGLWQPCLGAPERAIFEQAGCAERFAEASLLPAIFVAQWIRV